ncbi:hypothetical protein BKA67DRAFT_531807 [Truncatella angustata]|uniref:Uncharacterized protein n=1 Tax=Truncatella angustata TaxID=152316 RepID=A0A9P8UR22_9PEZI|nr:uncharacterized protein BKA67DRAFT_531807 [Truncatella angustata]KAH6656542.1 hypothetical protein BKA67DRAFT_531807 [Truncatella angustata]KAH8194756.1 hypothetical protein TruAng_011081 [Truncatella angustata]
MNGVNARPGTPEPRKHSFHYTNNVYLGSQDIKDSYHSIEGNQYKENVSKGSAIGVYGQIDQRFVSQPLLTQESGIARMSQQQLQRTELVPSFDEHSSLGTGRGRRMSFETLNINTAETAFETRKPHSLPTLQVPTDLSCSLKGRSRSTSPSSSEQQKTPTESRVAFAKLSLEEFHRRETGSWFEFGKVFEISDQHHDRTIANRAMVVVGRASDIVCLPLCRYLNITHRDTGFLKSRLQLQEKSTAPSKPVMGSQWSPVEMEVEEGKNMLGNIWINCEKPYTIHHQDVDVAFLGWLTPTAVDTVRDVYLQTQSAITRSDRVKESAATRPLLRRIWEYITGTIGAVIG